MELAQLRYRRGSPGWGRLSRTGVVSARAVPARPSLRSTVGARAAEDHAPERHLESAEVERQTQAKRRMEAVRVSLVGYTNAGKSTLLNQLTRSEVLVEDKLFATLTLRPASSAFRAAVRCPLRHRRVHSQAATSSGSVVSSHAARGGER